MDHTTQTPSPKKAYAAPTFKKRELLAAICKGGFPPNASGLYPLVP
jgi:hypothetical protein